MLVRFHSASGREGLMRSRDVYLEQVNGAETRQVKTRQLSLQFISGLLSMKGAGTKGFGVFVFVCGLE